MATTFDAHGNRSWTYVQTAPSPASSGTSLVVVAGKGAIFPAVPFNALLWPAGQLPSDTNSEIVRVTAISTDTLTITRAQEATAAVSPIGGGAGVGYNIANIPSAKVFTDIEAAINTIENTAAYLASANAFTAAQTITVSATGVVLGLVSTDAGAVGGPDFELYRNSASPAISDVVGQIVWQGRDSAANKQRYGYITNVLTAVTSTAESNRFDWYAIQAGAEAVEISVGGGIQVGAPTGGAKGVGTLNATSLYRNGTILGTSSIIDTGTSGTKVALTDGVNTWSGDQLMSTTLGVGGGANPGAASAILEVSKNTSGDAVLYLHNSVATGTASKSSMYNYANVAQSYWQTFTSTNTGTLFGITMGSYVVFLGSAGNGLLIGTTNTAPLIIGTNNVERMRVLSGGEVLIGVTTAITSGAMLNILAPDNGICIETKINAAQASVTTADVFLNFRSTSGVEGSVAGTGVAGVIAFNTFTGSHYTQVTGDQPDLLMLLEAIEGIPVWIEQVVEVQQPEKMIRRRVMADAVPIGARVIDKPSKGKAATKAVGPAEMDTVEIEEIQPAYIEKQTHLASPKDHLPMTTICKTRQSRAVFGFYGGTNPAGQALAFALGTGYALVANEGEDLDIGDYLMASGKPGLCCKQDDDLTHNYTAAKLTQPIRWAKKEMIRKVPVTYHCG